MAVIPMIKMDAPTAYERGVQYGTQAKKYILICLEYYKKILCKKNSWATVQRYADEFIPLVQAAYPRQMEEVKGIAAGSGLTVNDIMVINCRYEITKFPKLPECTTGAVLSDATKAGTVLSFKNWDYDERILPHAIALDITEESGLHLLAITEAGQMLRDGMNNYGIGLGANNLQSIFDTSGHGMPVTFMRRAVMECRTFAEAEQVILQSKRTVSGNLILTSGKTNQARDYELTPKGADTIDPENNIVTHANHFVVNPDVDKLTGRPKNRDARARELLMENYGNVTVEIIKQILSDHKYYPLSICGHPDPAGIPYVQHRQTVVSMIFDYGQSEAHICLGNPCQNKYVVYKV